MAEAYTNSYSIIDIDIRNSSGDLVDPDGDIDIEVYDYDLFNEETNQYGTVVLETTASQKPLDGAFATGRYFFELTPSITSRPTTLRVSWEYQIDDSNRTGASTVFVSVPYTTIEDVRKIDELNEYSDDDLLNMERLVSRIIDVYCGQSFGYSIGGTKIAMGNNSDFLWLPGRLWQLDDIRILDDYVSIVPGPSGEIPATDLAARSIKNYVVLDTANPWRLRNRRNYEYAALSETDTNRLFKSGFIYAITGNWGYPYVPAEVAEAARILVKTYFYDDSTYRDRYIDNIRAGNWRMEFKATGDETTGSANADMLLSTYKNINAAVI